MTFENYFGGWTKVINKQIVKETMQKVVIEYHNHECTPELNNIFRAFTLCDYNNLRVVFLGQDPYPQKNVATGIAFGNKENTDKLSPSLKVLKDAVINPLVPHGIIRFDNTLESWAKQGVLLLNSALTTECNKIGAHVLLWRSFIIQLLQNLSYFNTGIIYVLFGEQAGGYRRYINSNLNCILQVKHPSYFARTNTEMDSNLFDKINDILYKNNGFKIKWYDID